MKKIMTILLTSIIFTSFWISPLHATSDYMSLFQQKMNEAHNLIEGADGEDYSLASWKQLELAYEEGANVQKKVDASQAEIEQTTTKIQTALDGLVLRTSLLTAVKEAQIYIDHKDLYTKESYENFFAAYQNVLALYESREYYTAKEARFSEYELTATIEDLKIGVDYHALKAEVIDYKTIRLSWYKHLSATEYHIYRLNNDTNEWYLYKKTTEPTCLIEKVKTGVNYQFYIEMVRGSYGNVNTIFTTDKVSIKTLLKGEPKLTSKIIGTDKIQLNWTLVEGATRYIVYRKSATAAYKKILTLKGDITTYTYNSMKPNLYTYKIKAARYDSTERVMTNGSNAVEEVITYNAPKDFTLKRTSTTTIDLSWKKVSGCTHYEIYRANDKNSTYHKVLTTKNSYVNDLFVRKGEGYYYKVRGITTYGNIVVYSKFSEAFCAEK